MAYYLLQAHSGWRWIVIILVALTAIKVLIGYLGRQKWRRVDTNLVSLTRIAAYIQVVLGALLYITLQKWTNVQFTGEHVLMALLAVVGIEFAAGRAKRTRGRKMYLFALIGFVVALVLIYVALQPVGGLFA
jgi:TctA family transporter